MYDMENDALEEDDTSNYMWDGEKLPAVLRKFEEFVYHSTKTDIVLYTNKPRRENVK